MPPYIVAHFRVLSILYDDFFALIGSSQVVIPILSRVDPRPIRCLLREDEIDAKLLQRVL